MSLTTALAVWGAVISTLLAFVRFIELWRDRARLRVTTDARIAENVPHPVVSITAANDGRQPIAIVEAGFIVDADLMLTNERTGREEPAQPRFRIDEGKVQSVSPGGVPARYERPLKGLPALVHVDFPLRAYVIDSRNRTSYGGAFPLFRHLIGHGWKPPADTDPAALQAVGEPLAPTPVYRRWQVWKPKGARAPLFSKRRKLLTQKGRRVVFVEEKDRDSR